jgi:hypothetical protein
MALIVDLAPELGDAPQLFGKLGPCQVTPYRCGGRALANGILWAGALVFSLNDNNDDKSVEQERQSGLLPAIAGRFLIGTLLLALSMPHLAARHFEWELTRCMKKHIESTPLFHYSRIRRTIGGGSSKFDRGPSLTKPCRYEGITITSAALWRVGWSTTTIHWQTLCRRAWTMT